MRKRDEQKELLIKDKAIEMIVNEGFDGLSMQKLAKAAGVSPATIYIYYEDKDDLITSLCIEEFQKMSDATLSGFNPDLHFDEGLKIQWMNRAKYCMENPLRMHFLEQVKFSPYIEKAHTKMDHTFRNTMHAFLNNAIERKELIALPLEVYWSIAFSPLYTLVKFHMTQKGLPDLENFKLNDAILNQTIQLVLKALKP